MPSPIPAAARRIGSLWLTVFGVAFVVIFSAMIAYFTVQAYRHEARNQDPRVELELVRGLFQLLAVTVFGGGVKILGDVYMRHKQKKDARRQFQEQLVRDLIAAYSEGKQARRLLAARSLVQSPDGSAPSVDREQYDTLLEKVSLAQLRVENVRRQVEIEEDSFRGASDLRIALETMEEFLDDVLHEYRRRLPAWPAGETRVELASLPMLADFLAEAHEAGFYRRFREPHRRALGVLREELRS